MRSFDHTRSFDLGWQQGQESTWQEFAHVCKWEELHMQQQQQQQQQQQRGIGGGGGGGGGGEAAHPPAGALVLYSTQGKSVSLMTHCELSQPQVRAPPGLAKQQLR